MSAPAHEALRVERVFAAAPDAVFDAWTNPAVLERWWGPAPGWRSGCEVDLRVGGRYLMRMSDPESGAELIVGGEYHEIERPRRLVYSWCWEGSAGPHPGHVSLVTVEFLDEGGSTRVIVEHTGLPSEQSRQQHAAGWNGTFDNLALRVFGGEQR